MSFAFSHRFEVLVTYRALNYFKFDFFFHLIDFGIIYFWVNCDPRSSNLICFMVLSTLLRCFAFNFCMKMTVKFSFKGCWKPYFNLWIVLLLKQKRFYWRNFKAWFHIYCIIYYARSQNCFDDSISLNQRWEKCRCMHKKEKVYWFKSSEW